MTSNLKIIYFLLNNHLLYIVSIDNDNIHTVQPNVCASAQALDAGRVPNYLLLVSLLEHLCSVYEDDPERSRKIFNSKIFITVAHILLGSHVYSFMKTW